MLQRHCTIPGFLLITGLIVFSTIIPSYAADTLRKKDIPQIFLDEQDTLGLERIINYGRGLIEKEPDTARLLLESALVKSRQRHYTKGVISALAALSLSYEERGEYEKSIRGFQEAVKLCRGPYILFLPELYNNNANAYMALGNYPEAAINYYKAIKYANQLEQTEHLKYAASITSIYLNLFRLWALIGNEGKAVFYLGEAEAQAKKNGGDLLAEVYIEQAFHLLNVNHMMARERALKAQAFSNRVPPSYSDQFYYLLQATLAYSAIYGADKARADQHIDTLRIIYASGFPSNDYKSRQLLNLGKMERLLGRYKQSEKDLIMALQFSREEQLSYLEATAATELGELYADMQYFDKAYRFQMQAESIRKSLVTEEKSREILFMDQKYRLMMQDIEIAQQQLKTMQVKERSMRQKAAILLTGLLTIGLSAFLVVYRKNIRQKSKLQQQDLENLEKENGTNLLQSIIHSEEEERKRIAMELHDGISSMLSVVKLNLNTIGKKYAIAHNEHFNEAIRLLDTTAEDVRNTSHSLLPDTLLYEGLSRALQLYCKRNYQKTNLDFQIYGTPLTLSSQKEKQIFRIVQLIIEAVVYHEVGNAYLLQLNWHESGLFITLDIQGGIFRPDTNNNLEQEWTQIVARCNSMGGHAEYTTGNDITAINIDFDL